MTEFTRDQLVCAKDIQAVDPDGKKYFYNGFTRLTIPDDEYYGWFYTRNGYDKKFQYDHFSLVTIEHINEDKLKKILDGEALLFCENGNYYSIVCALQMLIRSKVEGMGQTTSGLSIGSRYLYFKNGSHFTCYYEKKYVPAAVKRLPVIDITELFNLSGEGVERNNYPIF